MHATNVSAALRLPTAELRPVGRLTPAPRNPRTHNKKQIRQIADSIRAFGFTNPVLVDGNGQVIAGHGRLAAAHHCIGAPLARREMYWSFEALLRNVRNIRLAPEGNDLSHMPGLMLRALKQLRIEFDPVADAIGGSGAHAMDWSAISTEHDPGDREA